MAIIHPQDRREASRHRRRAHFKWQLLKARVKLKSEQAPRPLQAKEKDTRKEAMGGVWVGGGSARTGTDWPVYSLKIEIPAQSH